MNRKTFSHELSQKNTASYMLLLFPLPDAIHGKLKNTADAVIKIRQPYFYLIFSQYQFASGMPSIYDFELKDKRALTALQFHFQLET